MTDELRLSVSLALPIEVATQSVGILAVKGAGKTYAASVLAEEMVEAGVQIVVIDPTDAWWGLRSSADGKSDGLAVYVFGGAHADVPLEPTAGELIADVIVDTGINAVLSLRHMRKGDQHRFFTAFAERLYFRKGEPAHRTPLHLFIDEAHSFAPQQTSGDTARMVGAVEDLVRLGRSSGIGTSIISQRPASVNKNVLDMCETLICLRVLSPRDRKSLQDWFESNDPDAQVKDFLGSLASLKNGEAWIWSPPLGLFERTQIRQRRTFDSSATPKPGEKRVEPRRLTEVDVEALGARIAETVESAKANDPKALRVEVARLQRQLAARPADEDTFRAVAAAVQDVEHERDAYRAEANRRGVMLQRAQETLERISNVIETYDAVNAADSDATVADFGRRFEAMGRTGPRTPIATRPAVTTDLTAYRRDILTAVAQRHPAPSTRSQVAMLSKKSIRSSMFAPALRALADAGYTTGIDRIEITNAGFDVLGGYDAPPTGTGLVQWWLDRVSNAEAVFLRALVGAYPRPLSREEIAEVTGRSLTSSQFTPTLRDLVNRDLIEEVDRGVFRAAEELGAVLS